MLAKDIMTTQVFTVGPETTVREIAVSLAEKGISALPVVDHGEVVGIVSEGDLIHRQELGTDEHRIRSSWYRIIEDPEAAAAFDAKAHGMRARDIMTPNVISVSEHASLAEVVDTMEGNNIRRLLVMREDKLVGILSRANIVRALAARPEGAHAPVGNDDDEIRFKVIETLEDMPGTSPWLTTVIVTNGVVVLYGTVEDVTARDPSRIAIENIPYVVKVRDRRATLMPY
jgi:CBS domain-containing protein